MNKVKELWAIITLFATIIGGVGGLYVQFKIVQFDVIELKKIDAKYEKVFIDLDNELTEKDKKIYELEKKTFFLRERIKRLEHGHN